MVVPDFPDFPSNYPAGGQQPGDVEELLEFLCEEVNFEPNMPGKIKQWIAQTVQRESCILRSISFIFCSDDYLHQLNVEYLEHDTLTDVVTFPYLAPPCVEGDIFISIDRVRENAEEFGVPFEQELYRVMIHGVLHLCGYTDKTPEEKKIMTEKEDEALAMLSI